MFCGLERDFNWIQLSFDCKSIGKISHYYCTHSAPSSWKSCKMSITFMPNMSTFMAFNPGICLTRPILWKYFVTQFIAEWAWVAQW